MQFSLLLPICTIFSGASNVYAEESQPTQPSPDEVVVVGSYLPLRNNTIAPLSLASITKDDMLNLGATSFKDIVQTLTIQSGAENNPDAFTQSATSGTSNINLRGLGVSSTLVLLNGRRTTQSAATTNSGVSFVDTNALVPDIALARIDILKSGASALYGSDAVAGVVDFRTLQNFSGGKLQLDYQAVAGEGHSDETKLQALFGHNYFRGNIMLALGYSSISELATDEHRLSRIGLDDVSALGNPGAFVLSPDDVASITRPTFVIDPTGCEEFGGMALGFGQDTGLGMSGLCRFDFGSYFSLVPDVEKYEGFVQWRHALPGGIEFGLEASMTDTDIIRGNSPSFPVLTQPLVPANHPDNPFGIDVGYFGRILGNGAARFDTPHRSETKRIAIDVRGALAEGVWKLSYVYARNDHFQAIQDTVRARLENALVGLGGAECDANTGLAGQGPCSYFNPFATSFTDRPNTPEMYEFLQARQTRDGEASATIIDALVTQNLGVLAGGRIGLAIGAQYRRDALALDYDDISNADGFAFLIGNLDSNGALEASAIFAEVSLPFTEQIAMQIALRYETYGEDIDGSLDPSVAIAWQPAQSLQLSASYATSFRAPSVFQKEGISTTLNQARDPITNTTVFVGNRSYGTTELTRETARNFNLGALWTPTENFTLNVEYWDIKVDDVIVQENHQSVLNAFAQDPLRVVRAGDPLSGPVVQINTQRINADTLATAGIDVSAAFHHSWQDAEFTLSTDLTFVTQYDISDPQAGKIDGVGNRNFSNIGTSMPQLRANISADAVWQRHQVHLTLRYIEAYQDDQNSATFLPVTIDDHLTVDAQYRIGLGAKNDSETVHLVFGMHNLTDEEPPFVATNGGYDSKVHNPNGRQLYTRLGFDF